MAKPASTEYVHAPQRAALSAARKPAVDVSTLVDTSIVVLTERLVPSQLPPKRIYQALKRIFDIVSCSLALMLLAVPMLFIALAIKCDSDGPVFYKQERLGLNGKPFMLIKFRSMDIHAEDAGAKWADEDDPRVTQVGRFLRASRLDELPQLFQVISGKLSLVGPRPERKLYYDEFEKYIHGFKQRLLVKPGLSGLAQVSGGYDLKPAQKILFDIEYIKNRSLLLDAKILLKTVGVLFSHKGAR